MQYQLGLYEKALPDALGLGEKLKAARRAGFDFFEISIDETDARLARLERGQTWRREIRQVAEGEGIPIKTICLSGHRKYPLGNPDPGVAARSLSILQGTLDLACDLGVRVIQLAGYDVYYTPSTPQTREIFGANLQTAVDMAAAQGVPLGFETMETPFMDTVAKAMAYVGQIRSPYLGLYPDTGNLANAAALYGHSLLGDIAGGRGHILAAHLKETLPGRYREVPFGTGHTPFPEVIETLRGMGVGLFLGEFWYDGRSDPHTYIQQAHDFLRHQFQLAEVRK